MSSLNLPWLHSDKDPTSENLFVDLNCQKYQEAPDSKETHIKIPQGGENVANPAQSAHFQYPPKDLLKAQ